jgi:hypothetical protein
VAVGRVAEDLRELAPEDRLPVAGAHVRDRVEAEILLCQVHEEVRARVAQVGEVASNAAAPAPDTANSRRATMRLPWATRLTRRVFVR